MDYFRRFILWFLSGLGAALGVAFVIWGYNEASAIKRASETGSALPSTSVTVAAVEPVALPKELTVAANLTNNAQVDVGVWLQLVVMQGSKVVFECDRSHPDTPAPGKTNRVQVSCHGVERERVPPDATFEVRVSRVFPVR